jgi:hypothetical protein
VVVMPTRAELPQPILGRIKRGDTVGEPPS